MKILISAYGTRGDVQPAIAVAVEIMKRGHDVEVIVSKGMTIFPEKNKIAYKVYGGESAFKQFGDLGGDLSAGNKILEKVKMHMIVQANELPELCNGVDILVGNCLDPLAASVAEMKCIPFVRIGLTPIFEGENRPTTLPLQKLPKWGNRLLWSIGGFAWELLFKPPINKERRRLGLPLIRSYKNYIESSITILALDRRLAPPAPQWKPNVIYTGYPFLKSEENLSQRLIAFINGGEAPFYFGFGSMGSETPEHTTSVILNAIEKAGIRAIISKGWAGLNVEKLPRNVFQIGAEPHSILFPHLRGVVHHGGAGTTHTAAMAGIPQLIIPHITDQFYYGQSIVENNLGPEPIPFRKLSVDRLVQGLLLLKNDKFNSSAKQFMESMVNNGVVDTVNEIEKCVKH